MKILIIWKCPTFGGLPLFLLEVLPSPTFLKHLLLPPMFGIELQISFPVEHYLVLNTNTQFS
jgi:hypothetical protein